MDSSDCDGDTQAVAAIFRLVVCYLADRYGMRVGNFILPTQEGWIDLTVVLSKTLNCSYFFYSKGYGFEP